MTQEIKSHLIKLMQINLSLVKSTLNLFLENQKLKNRVKELEDQVQAARKEKDRFISKMTVNMN